MSSILSNFLNRWRDNDAEMPQTIEYSPAPGTGIRFSPTLIDDLKNDHRQFFELHDSMVNAVTYSQIEEIPALMHKFDSLLTAHLLTEQVRLYAYMDAYFSVDGRTREMLRGYRSEMDRIGDSVRQMLRKYKTFRIESQLKNELQRDLDELGQVLEERMSREELTLYPLYMPVTT